MNNSIRNQTHPHLRYMLENIAIFSDPQLDKYQNG
jgi:hypothetical protein